MLSLIIRKFTNWFALAALIIGMSKKHGPIEFTKAHLRKVMYNENFLGIPYMFIVAMIGHANTVLYLPLIMQAFLETAKHLKHYLEQNPNTPVLPKYLHYITSAITQRGYYLEINSDIEVYTGVYLILVWFLGWSTLR